MSPLSLRPFIAPLLNNMSQLSLDQIATQLNSPDTKTRVLALLELQKDTCPADAAYPLIIQAIDDPNVQVRGIAVFALGIKQTPENLSVLINILESDADYNVRAMAAGALGYLEDKRAFQSLRHAFYEDTDWLVQFSAAVALGNLKEPQAHEVLLEALDSPNTLIQEAAIIALGEIRSVHAIEQLLKFADSSDWLIRQRLAEALGNLPSTQSQSALKFLSNDPHPQVKQAAQLSLKRLNSSTNKHTPPEEESKLE